MSKVLLIFSRKNIAEDNSEETSSEGDLMASQKKNEEKKKNKKRKNVDTMQKNYDQDDFSRIITIESTGRKIAHLFVFRDIPTLEKEIPNLEFDSDGWGCTVTYTMAPIDRSFKNTIITAKELIPKDFGNSVISSAYEENELYHERKKIYHIDFPFQIMISEEQMATLYDWAIIYLLKSRENIQKAKIVNRTNQNMNQDELDNSIIIPNPSSNNNLN